MDSANGLSEDSAHGENIQLAATFLELVHVVIDGVGYGGWNVNYGIIVKAKTAVNAVITRYAPVICTIQCSIIIIYR